MANHISSVRCFVTVPTKEQLNEACKYDFIDAIAVPLKLIDAAKTTFSKDIYIYLPAVLRDKYVNKIKVDESIAGVIASSFDELGLLEELNYPKNKIILDHRLYTFNNRSIQGFSNYGYSRNCIPYELSLKELKHRYNGDSQMIIYSRIPIISMLKLL